MKWSFLLFSSFLCFQAIAQYPATGNKMRLGWQTTGDGLVYRGAIGDTATLDPSGLNNAWMLLDTANGNLYAYRAKAWRLVSGGGGGGGVTMPFDSVTFNVNETDASLRELKYSEEKGYLQYGGQDSVQIPLLPGIWYVRNDTSVAIPKGTVVRATGTLGASGRIKVKHMIANGSIDAMYILGIAMHDIAVGADGYAMSQGKIRQVNTQAYSEGAVLYADVDTLGGLTQTEPGNGFLKLPIAFVVHSASNGVLAVRVTSGAYMRDLHDTEITSPVSNASLYYNSSEGIWRDTGATVLVADTTAMLSPYLKKADTTSLSNRINLKLNISDTSVFARDFQISGTAGQVAYFNAANAVTSDTAFRWSAANKTLSINTSTTSGANIIIKNSQEPSRSTVVSTQTFSADTTNWTRGTGWTFNGTAAVATASSGNLTYTPGLAITPGNAYEITYTLSGYSGGTLSAIVGNVTYALPGHNVTSNIVVLSPSTSGVFRFGASVFTGNLDNVSVVEISKPAPVVLAGQDDNSSALYGGMRYPNSSSVFIGDGGRFATAIGLVGFGEGAGFSHTTGVSNVYFGYQAGYRSTVGGYNNYFGHGAGQSNTIGSFNNFFGFYAGQNHTTGNFNNFFGRESGYASGAANNNNYFGDQAGRDATGSFNNAFGRQALRYSTGSYNNAFGHEAGLANTTGAYNNFFGTGAGYLTTTGNGNNFIGGFSGENNTTGSAGTAIGTSSGKWLRSGTGNIFIGNTSGPQVAADSLSGSNNIGIGQNAADNIRAAAAANVAIGNQVDLPTSNGSNQGVYQNVLFFTGASGTGTTIAAGSRAGIKTNAPASDFHVAGEVRIDDLKPTGTPRNIVGSSSTGDLSTMAWGNGLTVSVGDTVLRVDTSLILPKVNVSGTTNYLAKFTAGNRVGNSQVFDDGTNVGISDATPSYKLDVNGTAYATTVITNGNFVGNGQLTTADPRSGLVSIGPASGTIPAYNMGGYATFHGALHTTKPGNVEFGVGQNTTGKIIFYTDNFGQNQTMTLTNNSFVGINTSSPSRPLHVADATAIRIPVGNFAERGTSGAGDIRVRSDTANLEFHNGTSWQTVINNSDTSVFARDVQINGTTNRLAMFTGSNAVGNSGVFESGGNVGINTTTPSRRLHVEGETRISDLTTDPATRIVGADADGDLDAITIGNGVTFSSDTLKADTSVLATKTYVTDNAISTVYIPINLYAPGDTVANTTNSKAFFLVHSGLNGYCIDSYTVKAFSGSGTADIQIDKNGTGGNLQAISGTTTATKDTNIALATGDYIRGQVFNLSGTLVGLGLTLEIKKTCN